MFFVHVCDGCGARSTKSCARCVGVLETLEKPSVDYAGFVYEGLVRELIIGLKYRNHRSNARVLVDALLTRMDGLASVDVVTWVPTTRSRVRKRGVDHAELLARWVGRRLGVPVRGLLVKTSRDAQTGRSRRQRMVGPTFVVSPLRNQPRIMVVDDVVTTGTSMRRARASLVAAGARLVVCVAVAATPAPKNSG